MNFFLQVVAIYFGFVLFLCLLGGCVLVSMKCKFSFEATMCAFGLLLATVGILIKKYLQ